MTPAADVAAPEGRGAKRRIFARVLAAVVGLALVAYLVRGAGPDRVAAVLWQAGRWLPLILALEVFQLGTDFFALRSILGERWRHIPAATWVRSSARCPERAATSFPPTLAMV